MRMVKINDGCHVMPDDISEVTVSRDSDRVTVVLKTGVRHSVMADYGKGAYATKDRLINEINEALK